MGNQSFGSEERMIAHELSLVQFVLCMTEYFQ